MGTANLNISVVDKRMMRAHEAADYTGLSVKHFKNICPVQAIDIGRGNLRYDKRDLDKWIESVKSGAGHTERDAILSRL